MPYVNCPNCQIGMYTAAAYSTLDECPRCLEVLERRVPMFSADRRYEAPFGFRSPTGGEERPGT